MNKKKQNLQLMKQEINKFDVRIVQKHANPCSHKIIIYIYYIRKINQLLAT